MVVFRDDKVHGVGLNRRYQLEVYPVVRAFSRPAKQIDKLLGGPRPRGEERILLVELLPATAARGVSVPVSVQGTGLVEQQRVTTACRKSVELSGGRDIWLNLRAIRIEFDAQVVVNQKLDRWVTSTGTVTRPSA